MRGLAVQSYFAETQTKHGEHNNVAKDYGGTTHDLKPTPKRAGAALAAEGKEE